jgi:hypothetical protein
MSIKKTDDFFLKAISFPLGTYVGIFFAFTIERVYETRYFSSTLGAYVVAYELHGYSFINNLITECFDLANLVLVSSFIGVLMISLFLFLLQFTRPYIRKENFPFVLLLMLAIITWFFGPLMVITASIQNPKILFTPENTEIPPTDLSAIGYNIAQLDHFRLFSREFLSASRTMTVITLLFALSLTYFKAIKAKEPKSQIVLATLCIFILPIIVLLDYYVFSFSMPIVYGDGHFLIQPTGERAVVGGWLTPPLFRSIHNLLYKASWILFGVNLFWSAREDAEQLFIKIKKKTGSFLRSLRGRTSH